MKPAPRRIRALVAAISNGSAAQDYATIDAMAPPLDVARAVGAEGAADGAVEAAAKLFREQGFVQLDGLCDGEALAELAAAGNDVLGWGGETLLGALENPGLCGLLATVVGTDVQAISLRATAVGGAGGAAGDVCREFPRAERQLQTHGAFAHPLLSADVRLLLPLTPQTHLVTPGSQRRIEQSGSRESAVRCETAPGSALLVDFRTWRGDEQGAAMMLEVHYSKFANKQHASLRESVARLDSAGSLDGRPVLRQMLGLEVATELASPRHPTDEEYLALVAPDWERRPRPTPHYDGLDSGLVAQLQTFRRDGFIFLEGLVQGDALRRMQEGFYHDQAALQAEVDAVGRDGPFKLRHGYRKPCASGQDVFDVPGSSLLVGEHPDVFLDLLESPRVVALLRQIIGEDVSAVEYSARTVPPDGEGGYTEW